MDDSEETKVCCTSCQQTLEREDAASNVDGELYCSQCYGDKYFQCDTCNEETERDEAHEVPGRRGTTLCICERCFDRNYYTCESCDDAVHADDSYCALGTTYCQECYDERYTTCDECGETVDRDSTHYDEANGQDLCSSCFDGNSIHSYSYKPTPKFHGKGPIFFGIELEVEATGSVRPNRKASEIESTWFYCKCDGSLNNGFEIVTHPLSWEWIEANKQKFKSLMSSLREDSFSSYDAKTCGMHVHISRDALSPLTVYKLQKLFYENPDRICEVSRRSKSNLRQWATAYDLEPSAALALKKPKDIARYVALNMTEHTVECRIFRGTLNVDSFFANLEFLKCALEYCDSCLIGETSWDSFVEYAKRSKSVYPLLFKFFCKLGFIRIHAPSEAPAMAETEE